MWFSAFHKLCQICGCWQSDVSDCVMCVTVVTVTVRDVCDSGDSDTVRCV